MIAKLTPQERSERVKQGWAKLTPQQRSERGRRIAKKRQQKLAKLTPEQRAERSRKIGEIARRTLAKLTTKQRSERAKKGWDKLTPQQRSEEWKKRQAKISPEKRKAMAEKVKQKLSQLTSAERAEISRNMGEMAEKSWAKLTPQERVKRRINIRRGMANLAPAKKMLRAMKIGEKAKQRWGKFSAAEKSEIMRGVVKSAWAKLTTTQRFERARRGGKTLRIRISLRNVLREIAEQTKHFVEVNEKYAKLEKKLQIFMVRENVQPRSLIEKMNNLAIEINKTEPILASLESKRNSLAEELEKIRRRKLEQRSQYLH